MIWHDELVTVLNAPKDSVVRLFGIYNPPELQANCHAIELKAEISFGPESTALIITLYTHAPSGLGYEEPTKNDIKERYNSKILKAKSRLQSTNFSELSKIKRIL